MSREEIYFMMLQVLDNPTGLRIVICTKLPTLVENHDDTVMALGVGEELPGLSYIIYWSTDEEETAPAMWHVITNCDRSATIPTNMMLLSFIEQVMESCPDACCTSESY